MGTVCKINFEGTKGADQWAIHIECKKIYTITNHSLCSQELVDTTNMPKLIRQYKKALNN